MSLARDSAVGDPVAEETKSPALVLPDDRGPGGVCGGVSGERLLPLARDSATGDPVAEETASPALVLPGDCGSGGRRGRVRGGARTAEGRAS